jgi:hypothetical protein
MESALPLRSAHNWIPIFKNGRTSVTDERSGRPSTSTTEENIEQDLAMVLDIRQMTIDEVAHQSWFCSWDHPRPTWVSEDCARYVPKQLRRAQAQPFDNLL